MVHGASIHDVHARDDDDRIVHESGDAGDITLPATPATTRRQHEIEHSGIDR